MKASVSFKDVESAYVEFSRPSGNESQSRFLAACLKGYKNTNYIKVMRAEYDRCFVYSWRDLQNSDNPDDEFFISHSSVGFYNLERFVFDKNNRYLIGVSKNKIHIVDLTDPKCIVLFFLINQEIFDEIVDVSMNSESTEYQDWNILVAGKVKKTNQIRLFDPI